MNRSLKNWQKPDFESIDFIDLNEAIYLHDASIRELGGLPGIRDSGLLESALHQPYMIARFGDDEEQELSYLAAVYFLHIIKNHPFLDGNKRTGLLTATEFLYRNGLSPDMSHDELYQLAIDTAASQVGKAEIAAAFAKAVRPY